MGRRTPTLVPSPVAAWVTDSGTRRRIRHGVARRGYGMSRGYPAATVVYFLTAVDMEASPRNGTSWRSRERAQHSVDPAARKSSAVRWAGHSGRRQRNRAGASGRAHGSGPLVRPRARGCARHGSPGSPALHRRRSRCHHHEQLLRNPRGDAALWTLRTLRRLEPAFGANRLRRARPVGPRGLGRRGGIGQQLRPVQATRHGDDVRSLPRTGGDSRR